jgi:hypothetical protein
MSQELNGVMQYDAWNKSNIVILTLASYFTNLPLVLLFINNLPKHLKFNNMQFRIVILLYNFMQVLNSMEKHPTKNEYFSKHILMTTIYLL